MAEKTVPTGILHQFLLGNLKLCSEVGLKVGAIVCDQSTTNASLYKLLGTGKEQPFFFYDNKKIFALFDVPHIFKNIRTNLMKYQISLPNHEGNANWTIIEELYKLDSSSKTRVCPRLTHEHLSPNKFQKINVRLALQILSKSTATGIQTMHGLRQFSENVKNDAMSTADFLLKINSLFDCLNSKSKFSPNPMNCALLKGNNIESYLKEMFEYISKIKYIVPSKKVNISCLTGLLQTISGVLQLSEELFSKFNDWTYLCTNKLNQDPLENLFGQIRYKKRNPNVLEFNDIMSRIASVRLLYASKYGNCEDDCNEMLQLDWKAVVAEEGTQDIYFLQESQNSTQCCSGSISLEENYIEIENLVSNTTEESSTSTLSDNASRYFSGYIVHNKLKRGIGKNCNACESDMLQENVLDTPSELLIQFKNYNQFALKAPNEPFFQMCKSHIQTFDKIFSSKSHIEGLKEKIVSECTEKYSSWYTPTSPCFAHRTEILNFMILVLIRKNCLWEIDRIKLEEGKRERSTNDRLNILLQ